MHCACMFLFLLPPLLHHARLFCSRRCLSVAMVKDKAAALERAKKVTGAAKGKKQNRGSSSRAGLPPGWIQGDWIRSSVRQEDLVELAKSRLIARGVARLPEGEMEPRPQPGECVLLATHVDRGFSLPPHPFFQGFLNFFGAQLHHFSPNTITYLVAFVSMCKNFLGC